MGAGTALPLSCLLRRSRGYPMIAILGAGHAGRAMAGDLALRGAPVALWNRTPANIAALRARGGVELEGEVEGFGRMRLVTSDLEEALSGARLVVVCVPAFAHRELAEHCAPLLCQKQLVVLNPGRTFGALEFSRALAASACAPGVLVAEAATHLMTARSTGPAEAYIARTTHAVPVAALPAGRHAEA